jgi:hypothetical protein
MDQIPSEEVRKRLATMSKRVCYDEEDRMCLLQILTLINNLEVLSQQQDHQGSNENSLDSIVVSICSSMPCDLCFVNDLIFFFSTNIKFLSTIQTISLIGH